MFYGELTDSKYYKYKKNNILSVAVSKKAIHIEHTDVLVCTFVNALFFYKSKNKDNFKLIPK